MVWLFAILFIFGGVLAGVEWWARVTSRARETTFVVISNRLGEFYREHGRYPKNLNELELDASDGGKPSILRRFEYDADDEGYVVSLETKRHQRMSCAVGSKALESIGI